jgi:cation:H+ antiporter
VVSLVFDIVFTLAVLVSGIVLLNIASDKAVEHSVHVASALGISSLMIGLVLVSIGTDLPEIANSIVSCSAGHGDIDVGDSLGSILTQITLVLGLLPFLGRIFKVDRKEALVIGSFQVATLMMAILVALTGFTREKALLLIITWPVSLWVIRRTTSKNLREQKHVKRESGRHYLVDLVIAALGFAGVAIGALAVVQSVVSLSERFGVPEFLISFFVLAIGTSLPELVVDLTAVRKKQYELVIGDVIGSCIVDATVSISIGQLLFPAPVFVEAPQRSLNLALYTVFASMITIALLAWRQKVDRKTGACLFILYGLAYVFLYGL